MKSLKTTDKYVLAQILVSGDISRAELRTATDFNRTTLRQTMRNLSHRNLLEETLYAK